MRPLVLDRELYGLPGGDAVPDVTALGSRPAVSIDASQRAQELGHEEAATATFK